MKTVVIADVSKAFPNTIQQTLGAVRTFCSANDVAPADIVLIARPEHIAFQAEFPAPAKWQVTAFPSAAPGIVAQLLRGQPADGSTVMLLSFNVDVWKLSKQFWPGLQVRAQHINATATLPRPQVQSSLFTSMITSGPEPQWTFDHVSSLDEALQTLVTVLREQGSASSAKPFRQTTLRPWMGMLNSKFSGNAASTQSSGMIGVLVRIAAIRSLIEVGGSDPGDLVMWLKQPTAPSTHVQTEASSSALPTPDPKSAALEGTLERHIEDPPPSSGAPKPRRKRLREPDKFLCDLMSANIEKQKLGPFPSARPVVYAALEAELAMKKRPLAGLVEAAIRTAERDMPGSTQPWTAIRFVTQRQLLRSGAALDERGKPLPDNWSSGRTIVHAFAPDWRMRAEGEILLALFTAQEVTGDHLVDIARSVWGSSGADALSMAQAVLELLIATQRVEEDESGVFRVKRTLEAASVPQPTPLKGAPISTKEVEEDDAEGFVQ